MVVIPGLPYTVACGQTTRTAIDLNTTSPLQQN